MFYLLERKVIYTNYLELFCMEYLFSPIMHSFNYVQQYGCMNVYLKLLGYHPLLCYSFAQPVPGLASGSPFSWLCVPLICSHCFMLTVIHQYVLSGLHEAHFVYSFSQPQNFSKETWFFLVESNIRTKVQTLACAHYYWYELLPRKENSQRLRILEIN